jgi:putative ABC transport system substrate-binding protein
MEATRRWRQRVRASEMVALVSWCGRIGSTSATLATGPRSAWRSQIAPRVTRVGLLRDPSTPGGAGQTGAIQAATSSFGVEIKALDVRDAATIERGLSTFAREPNNNGLIVLSSPAASVHHKLIVELAARFRIPAIYPYPFFVKSGGLLSYGIDNHDLWQRAAGYVDRILKGANPAELPVQEPTKFELLINLKTAKALGLVVPPQLLARADEVIE